MATGSRALFGREVGWLDRSLVLACAAGLAITVLAGLLQVRFGSHPVTFRQVVATVFDPLVWLRPNVLASFLPGDGLTGALGFERSFDLPTETLIVWSVRLPRVLVAALVGLNLARSGAVFQAVTRNGLASRFTLGVPPGAGLAVLLTLIVFVNVAALLPLTAALGGTAAFLVVYAIAWQGGPRRRHRRHRAELAADGTVPLRLEPRHGAGGHRPDHRLADRRRLAAGPGGAAADAAGPAGCGARRTRV